MILPSIYSIASCSAPIWATAKGAATARNLVYARNLELNSPYAAYICRGETCALSSFTIDIKGDTLTITIQKLYNEEQQSTDSQWRWDTRRCHMSDFEQNEVYDGIQIGGNVDGNIVIGNNNQVDNTKN